MKKLSMLAVGLLLLGVVNLPAQTAAKSGGNAAVEQNLEKNENTLTEAWKNHNTKPFEQMLEENFVDVGGDGMHQGKAGVLKEIASNDCTTNSYSLSDFHYLWLDKDHVVVTYQSAQDGTCGGKKVPEKEMYTSIWSKKSGKWMAQFHQGTAQGTGE